MKVNVHFSLDSKLVCGKILHLVKTLCLYIFASKAVANVYSLFSLAYWYLIHLVNPNKDKLYF